MRRIALLTDFGTGDPYAAAMRGVIASRTEAPVVDLSHDIAPQDVFGAAWFLRMVVKWWPEGTIFVCVVDPGVGTDRRIIAAEQGGHSFLAPDNGLLSLVIDPLRVSGHSVENAAFFVPNGSDTFHGRDRFAPVAAAMANDVPLSEFGPSLDRMMPLPYDRPGYDGIVRGTVVAIDRFGNVITDLEVVRLPFASFALRVAGVTISRLERTYGQAAAGPFLIAGSSGCIEISIANGSAAEHLQIRRLDRVELWPSDPP